MAVITIPKELTKKGDLVILPRKEYEEFLGWRKTIKPFKTFTATAAQKRALTNAREEYKRGEYITLEQLENELGVNRKKTRQKRHS